MPIDYNGPIYVDGYLGTRRQLSTVPVIRRPFKDDPVPVPDMYARHLDRSYDVDPFFFNPRSGVRTSHSSGFTRTEDFSHSDWTKPGIGVITTDQLANPLDGLVTVDRFNEAPANVEQKISRNFTVVAEGSFVASLFLSKLGRDWIRIIFNDGTQDFIGWFNVTTGETAQVAQVPLIGPSIRNGGFETAGATPPAFNVWSETSLGGTITRDITVFHAGAASCKIVTDASGNGGYVSQTALLQPGRNYNLSVRIRKTNTSIVASLRDGSGNVLASIPATGNTGVFDLISRNFTATDTTIRLQASGGVSQSMWFDDVTVTPLDVPTLYMERQPEPGQAFWRASMVFYPRAGTGSFGFQTSTDGTTVTFAGDITKGVYAWGANLDSGTMPGPYVSAVVAARTVNTPDCDAIGNFGTAQTDCFALLTAEDDLTPANSARGFFKRTYSRVPATRYLPGSKWIQRPQMNDVYTGSNWAVVFVDETDSWVFTARKNVVGTPGFVSATINSYEVTGHGFVVGDKVAMWLGNKLVDRVIVTQVPDANHFYALNTTLLAYPTTVQAAKNAAARYVSGDVEATIQAVTEFYALGYTLKTSTSGTCLTDTDIPLQSPQMDPLSWLAAIVAGSTWAIESTQGKQPYAGIILGYHYTRALMADALKTVTP